jgi:hypothetical protein
MVFLWFSHGKSSNYGMIQAQKGLARGFELGPSRLRHDLGVRTGAVVPEKGGNVTMNLNMKLT